MKAFFIPPWYTLGMQRLLTDIPVPVLIANPSAQIDQAFYIELNFQVAPSHSDSSTNVWESL